MRAIERAHACATGLPTPSSRPASDTKRWVAIGDPQAPLARFLDVLDQHRVLGEDGWVAPDVQLISIGDHFDWGGAEDAGRAADEGLALLGWLASHDESSVVLIAGNHDLGRVGELATFDDETFAAIRREAVEVYAGGKPDRDAELDFLSRWPALPTAELAARDFAGFRAQQRVLVTCLLRQGRLRLAYAPNDRLLFLHAGVTTPQLEHLAIDPRGTARAIASALDARLAQAVRTWSGPPERLVIEGVHRPGDAASGEGDGMLYHRAGRIPKARRYDPRTLPRGLVQAIGHVRDKKSRELLGTEWTDSLAPQDGALRHLTTDGTAVRYARGLPASIDPGLATMVFLDGGMAHTDPARYEVLESSSLR